MRGSHALILAAALLSGAAVPVEACIARKHFESEKTWALACDLEKSMPFTVKERRVFTDHIAFCRADMPIRGRTRFKHGVLFDGDGRILPNAGKARRLAEKISRLEGCRLEAFSHHPRQPAEYTLACPLP